MKINGQITTIFSIVYLFLTNQALASGFSIIEQSGSGMGNAFAGAAASAVHYLLLEGMSCLNH